MAPIAGRVLGVGLFSFDAPGSLQTGLVGSSIFVGKGFQALLYILVWSTDTKAPKLQVKVSTVRFFRMFMMLRSIVQLWPCHPTHHATHNATHKICDARARARAPPFPFLPPATPNPNDRPPVLGTCTPLADSRKRPCSSSPAGTLAHCPAVVPALARWPKRGAAEGRADTAPHPASGVGGAVFSCALAPPR